MGTVEARKLDITKTNIAVQELIEVTENPRHRYLLQAYDRHRNLEHAGRYEEIFAPEMTVEHPVYRFNMIGQPPMQLEGREQVEPLYSYWAQTNQSVFYNETETVAVGTGWSSAPWSATSSCSAPTSPPAARTSIPRPRTCFEVASRWCGPTTSAAGLSERMCGNTTRQSTT